MHEVMAAEVRPLLGFLLQFSFAFRKVLLQRFGRYQGILRPEQIQICTQCQVITTLSPTSCIVGSKQSYKWPALAPIRRT